MSITRTIHLVDMIALHKPQSITEIGFAKGQGAWQMLQEAAKHHPVIEYHAFDLFEGLNDDIKKREFQGKAALSLEQATALMGNFAKSLLESRGCELHWHLHKGPTSETLLDSSADAAKVADFCYIDGGHSVETIKWDAEQTQGCKVRIFDDFYYDRPAEFYSKFGANNVVQELFNNNYAILPIIDSVPAGDFSGELKVGQVAVPRDAWHWNRLQAPLTVMRHHKPKTMAVYCDQVSVLYLKMVAEKTGTEIIESPFAPADMAYVDTACWLPDGWHFMDEETQRTYLDGDVKAPIKIFGGLCGNSMEGCGHIMNSLKGTEESAIAIVGLDVVDGVEIGAFVSPKAAWPAQKSEVHVNTRNCVADEVILSNVSYSTPRIKTWVQTCRPHEERCLFVSAGPSLPNLIEDVRQEAAKGGKVVCVKHAHDLLIENGIIPWGCVLLDPRDHVQHFIENPHPGTIYFTASMVSHTTVDKLLEKDARIVGYHAAVGAGENKILPPGTQFLVGGTSAATRGLPLMMMLGFRKFVLFAYDSCYLSRPEKVGEKTVLGYERFIKVEVNGRKFWSELELVAQAQDFREFIKTVSQSEILSNLEIDIRGDGLIPHLWNTMRVIRPKFEDVARGW